MVVVFRRIEQSLGRDTTHVQAGSAGGGFPFLVGAIVYAGGGHSKLSTSDCGDIAGGAAANHHDIEFISHKFFYQLKVVGPVYT